MAENQSPDGDERMRLARRLADEIRKQRRAAGLSQPALAARIGYTPQYVSLAERPKRGLASEPLVRAIDQALGAEGALLALRDQADAARKACRPGAAPSTVVEDATAHGRGPDTSPAPGEVENSKRRDLIASAAAIAFGAGLEEPVVSILTAADALRVPTRVRPGDVAHLRSFWETWRASSGAGGEVMRHQALAMLRWATGLLESSCTPGVRRELAVMTAKLADSAAWATFDTGRYESARRLSLYGLQVARESGDLGMRTCVASGLARQEIHVGNWAGGLELVQLAFTAGDALPPNAVADLHTVNALAYARKQDAAHCQRSIGAALDRYRPDSVPNDPFWLSYLTPVKFERDLAFARYDLALPGADVSDRTANRLDLMNILAANFRQYPAERVLGKAITATRLATLLCLEGEQRAAAQWAEDVITLAGQVRSARLADDLRVLLRMLPAGDRADEDTRDLRHRLSTTLTEMT